MKMKIKWLDDILARIHPQRYLGTSESVKLARDVAQGLPEMTEELILHANVLIRDYTSGESYIFHNTITEVHRERYAAFLKGDSVTSPSHIGIGVQAKLASEDPSRFTTLKNEILRKSIDSKALQTAEIVRYVGIFQSSEATGSIKEVGIFDAAEQIVLVSACDVIGNWTSEDGSITLETADFLEGVAGIKGITTGDGALSDSFDNSVDIAANAQAFTEADAWLQLGYFIDDKTNISAMTVRAYTGGAAYYEWSIANSDLTDDDYTRLNLKFSDASKTGSPDITSSNIERIKINNNKSPSQVVTERLDDIRVFSTNGNMWARLELPATIDKTLGTVIGIFWFFSMIRGGAEEVFTAFDREQIVDAGGSVETFTSTKVNPADGSLGAQMAVVHIRSGGPINWTVDGSTPTASGASAGPMDSGTTFTITGNDDITNFKFIKDTVAPTNPVYGEETILEVEYYR